MNILWAPEKSADLKRRRGVSFEEIIQSELIAALEHPGRTNQNILLFKLDDYIWVVPYVTQESAIFLKTLYPSRKYTKAWIRGELA